MPIDDYVHRLSAHRRRFGTGRVALTAAAAVLLIAGGSLAITRSGHSGAHPPAALPPRPANYPTEYWFGTASLPGYALSDLSLDHTGQQFDYKPAHPPAGVPAASSVSVSGFTPSAGQLATMSADAPVTVGRVSGRYGLLSPVLPADTTMHAVFWQIGPGKWAAATAYQAGKNQSIDARPLSKTDLARLAGTMVPKVDDHVALVKVGYLPAKLRFDYAAQYVDQGTLLSPDGTTGTGYRTLSFIDRSVVTDGHSTLDIASVIKPVVNLADATKAELPSLNGYGPWTRSTVRGHLAWIAPHAVLIQWGSVQIGLASERTEGDKSTPLLTQPELLKVANSLTVPTNTGIGHGYSLSSAIPANAYR